jgi:hypothetical protein
MDGERDRGWMEGEILEWMDGGTKGKVIRCRSGCVRFPSRFMLGLDYNIFFLFCDWYV